MVAVVSAVRHKACTRHQSQPAVHLLHFLPPTNPLQPAPTSSPFPSTIGAGLRSRRWGGLLQTARCSQSVFVLPTQSNSDANRHACRPAACYIGHPRPLSFVRLDTCAGQRQKEGAWHHQTGGGAGPRHNSNWTSTSACWCACKGISCSDRSAWLFH